MNIQELHTQKMIVSDKCLKETIREILAYGDLDQNPRPKWADGTPAHAKYITQKVFKYDILKGEYPITTLRNTALKGAWYDIEAIYIKQTNIIEEMHPSIHSWWKDFIVSHAITPDYKECQSSIGQTYGHTVRRYNLMNKLLDGMEKNPFSRRHMINLWQEQQMIEDPRALVPCAYQTNWNIKEDEYLMDYTYSGVSNGSPVYKTVRQVDLTLHQRSQDFCMTSSINPAQYCKLGMMVCNHLTYKTGILHILANFMHIVENCHIYDRHFEAAQEILDREPTGLQPKIELICEPKDFYSHTWEDFRITGLEGVKPLSTKLELAV